MERAQSPHRSLEGLRQGLRPMHHPGIFGFETLSVALEPDRISSS
jgi:hypothetical protein